MSSIAYHLVEENKDVTALTKLLTKKGRRRDAQAVADVFNCICGMERDLKKAIDELTTLRSELSVMREEQKHPIKTMLHKAADSLMSKLKSAYKQILSMKEKFIGGCKQAVEDIKDKGITAANGVVCALNIKGDLESSRERMKKIIGYNEKKIADIDAAAAQYHTAGRAIKNITRALVGKEAVPEIKPNGKLAKLLQAPFRLELNSSKRSLARTERALARINKLEKAAELRAEREKPSVLNEMTQHKTAAREQPDIAVPKRVKTVSQEI